MIDLQIIHLLKGNKVIGEARKLYNTCTTI